MRWIVTGGCGFLGSNLAAALLAGRHEVIVFDNLSRVGSRENLAWLRAQRDVRFVPGDIRQQVAVDELLHCFGGNLDAVAHLAGQVAATTSVREPRFDFDVNVVGTINVLESVRRHAPRAAVLFSSTNKVYGELAGLRTEETPTRYRLPDWPLGLDESLPLDFRTPYGCSKGAADQYVREYYRSYGLRTVVLRHSSIYGGRQFATYDQGWVGWFCQKALEMGDPGREPFTISGSGKQVRDLLHADDIVRCYLLAYEHLSEIAGEAYNIGGGSDNSLSLLELFEELQKLTGQTLRWRQQAARPGDQKVFVADIRKAERDFGWRPRVGKADGLRAMLQWTRSELQSRAA